MLNNKLYSGDNEFLEGNPAMEMWDFIDSDLLRTEFDEMLREAEGFWSGFRLDEADGRLSQNDYFRNLLRVVSKADPSRPHSWSKLQKFAQAKLMQHPEVARALKSAGKKISKKAIERGKSATKDPEQEVRPKVHDAFLKGQIVNLARKFHKGDPESKEDFTRKSPTDFGRMLGHGAKSAAAKEQTRDAKTGTTFTSAGLNKTDDDDGSVEFEAGSGDSDGGSADKTAQRLHDMSAAARRKRAAEGGRAQDKKLTWDDLRKEWERRKSGKKGKSVDDEIESAHASSDESTPGLHKALSTHPFVLKHGANVRPEGTPRGKNRPEFERGRDDSHKIVNRLYEKFRKQGMSHDEIVNHIHAGLNAPHPQTAEKSGRKRRKQYAYAGPSRSHIADLVSGMRGQELRHARSGKGSGAPTGATGMKTGPALADLLKKDPKDTSEGPRAARQVARSGVAALHHQLRRASRKAKGGDRTALKTLHDRIRSNLDDVKAGRAEPQDLAHHISQLKDDPFIHTALGVDNESKPGVRARQKLVSLMKGADLDPSTRAVSPKTIAKGAERVRSRSPEITEPEEKMQAAARRRRGYRLRATVGKGDESSVELPPSRGGRQGGKRTQLSYATDPEVVRKMQQRKARSIRKREALNRASRTRDITLKGAVGHDLGKFASRLRRTGKAEEPTRRDIPTHSEFTSLKTPGFQGKAAKLLKPGAFEKRKEKMAKRKAKWVEKMRARKGVEAKTARGYRDPEDVSKKEREERESRGAERQAGLSWVGRGAEQMREKGVSPSRRRALTRSMISPPKAGSTLRSDMATARKKEDERVAAQAAAKRAAEEARRAARSKASTGAARTAARQAMAAKSPEERAIKRGRRKQAEKRERDARRMANESLFDRLFGDNLQEQRGSLFDKVMY